METLIHADIFFFVATIGLCIFTIVLVIALIYIIRLFRQLGRIAEHIENGFDTATEEMRELLDRLYESTLFRFLFPRKRKARTREE